MGEEYGPRNILLLKSIVKSTTGLERGRQMSPCLITENNHTSFYMIHNSFYDSNMKSLYSSVIFTQNTHFKPKVLGLSFMQCRSIASHIDLKL